MLKTRVIPTLLLKNSVLVKSVQFATYRPIGLPRQAVRVYDMREVDEMVILDIEARLEDREPRFAMVADLAEECFMPLAVGGGIRTVAHVRELMRNGADKVVLNTEAFLRPAFIGECVRTFGSQCIVVSIDARENRTGGHEVFIGGGREATGARAPAWAREAADLGAGEILLTSIDRDGTMQGFDVELVRSVAESVSVPVIASGGAGHARDFPEIVLKGRASAVAAASVFHFTQLTPRGAKTAMRDAGIEVRL
jgi:cyclase